MLHRNLARRRCPGSPDPSTLILWVAYHHEGRNLAKRVEEPYPKSVPAHTALVHANRVNEVPRATGFNPGTDQGCLAKMSELAEINQRAAETGTHTLGPNTMAAACEEAERLGIPRSLRAKMIRGLTADDPLVEARVLAGTTGMTRTSVSCDQADAIAQAAETAGADLHAISDMLNAVGHSASVHGTDPGPLPDSTAQIMTMMLEKHGMSKPQAQAMCAPLYHNPKWTAAAGMRRITMNSVTRQRTIKNLANFTFIGNNTATWAILMAMLFDAEPERLVTTLVAVTAA